MTAQPLVIAVDCSTTAAKAIIVDPAGHVVASGKHDLTTTTPAAGFHEQDATTWRHATMTAIGQAVAALEADARERVAALAITHQRESFALLDSDGTPLRPAILWVDSRAHQQIAALGSQTLAGGASVHDVSGKPPDTTPAIYKIAWLAEHETALIQAASSIADVQAYLSLHLTGQLVTSRASADTLGLFDLAAADWSDELVQAVGLRRNQLPGLVDSGETIGNLLPAVAAEIGLPRPIPLIAGIGDGQSAGLALGIDTPGVAYLNLGTSMVCGIASPTYLTSPAFRTLIGVGMKADIAAQAGADSDVGGVSGDVAGEGHDVDASVAASGYVLETVLNAAAYVAGWAARFADSDVYTMEAAAAQIPAGAEGLLVLPYWNAAQTPYWDPLARGAVIGWHGRHTTAHLYRAILEGVAFELRLQLGMMEEATGLAVRELRAVGGGARSVVWAQIVADVTGRNVDVCSDGELSALGAAINAHTAVTPGFTRWPVAVSHRVSPDAGAHTAYTQLFEAYRTMYPALRETFALLAG